MVHTFYLSSEYRRKQSLITKENWEKGKYITRIKSPEKRFCKNPDCDKTFVVKKPSDPKKFCSHHCSAYVANMGRKLSSIAKSRISKAISTLPKSKRGKHFTKSKIKMICQTCQKTFKVVPYLSKTRKYCSVTCSIKTIGKITTSAKASRGKNGIRIDIDPIINFYSTWEANVARVFNLVNIRWKYAPKIFDLDEHTYRPDFYLSDFDSFVEVKNFMGEYSLQRDRLFRKKYPNIKLDLIMKGDYLNIRDNYKELIGNWET